MSVFDSWSQLSDTVTLSGSDQVRVQCGFDCLPGATPSSADVQNAFAAMPNIAGVSDISGSVFNFLNPVGNSFEVQITPVDGSTVGDIRAAAMTALNLMNSQKTIPCRNFTVGLIEKFSPGQGVSGLLNTPTGKNPLSPSLGTTALLAILVVGLVAIAIIGKEV